MKAHIKLGRILGMEVGLHLSWFIIAFLIIMSLASQFQIVNPAWSEGVVWATAITTGLLFFVTIILHELSHAMVARARNLPVKSITLFALGGVAQIEKEAGEPSTEFFMGLAGPLMSFFIGFVCLMLAWALGWSPLGVPETPLLAMLMWLGYINFSLAIFNLIPGFPLDGGRILRGIIWWITGDGIRATRIATRVGQVIAFAFIVLGVVRFFLGAGFDGLWVAFIGWFLLEAAGASRAQVEINERLKGVNAGDVVERDCLVVDGHDNLQNFVNNYLLRTGTQCFLVRDGHGIEGIITPYEVIETDRTRWAQTTVEQAMRPLDRLSAVNPETPISEALEIMDRENANELPVAKHGRIEGFLTRGGVMRLLQTRLALEM
ncbi:MAG TPA: site-2 protease family protein [Anaerolineales bacterium]|nr:site-2 protease family protein [Anaerolineales bacterium]